MNAQQVSELDETLIERAAEAWSFGFSSPGELAEWLERLEQQDEPEPDEREEPPAQQTAPTAPRPRIVTMSSVAPEAVEWLWPGRVPLGALTFIDGDPGLGKSLVTADLAARVSRGSAMPDGARSDLAGPAHVVLVFCEDDPAATVRPRLDAAGADVTRIHQLEGTERPDNHGVKPLTLSDVTTIDQTLTATGARLVVVDPWAAHIGGRDARDDAKMRELLTPLAALARKHAAAIVIVRHLRKASGSAITAGAGSIGITGAARSVLLVAASPEDADARVLAVSKGNLAVLAPSITFTIEGVARELPSREGLKRVEVPRVVWGDVINLSADELAAAGREEPAGHTAQAGAADAILDALKSKPLTADALKEAVHKDTRCSSDRTYERARAELRKGQRIWRHRHDPRGVWWWGAGEKPPTEWLDANRQAAS